MPSWTEIASFDGVDLTESYVLGWEVTAEGLIFDLDVALVPSHPYYAEPVDNERTCWRRGRLVFPAANKIEGLLAVDQVRGSTDASGARDYGNIDSLSYVDGEAHAEGEFGIVHLRCQLPYVRIGPA